MTMTTDYRAEAQSDASDTALNFIDEIVEALCENREASDDLLNDYPNGDSYHHENHTDRSYDLSDAAEVLDQLSEYEETDTGLWDGLAPRDAIGAQAAYTYGNAVCALWCNLIKEINKSCAIDELLDELDAVDDDTEDDEPPKRTADEIKADIKETIENIIA